MTAPGSTENVFGLPSTISADEADSHFRAVLEKMRADPSLVDRAAKTTSGNPINIRKIKDVDKWVEEQIAGVESNAERWLDGMKNPSANPKDAALANEKGYEEGVKAAMANKSYGKGIAGYDLDAAIETAEAVGKSKLVEGVKARKKKITKAVTALRPAVLAAKEILDRMPTSTLTERKAKAMKAIDLMHEIGQKG